MSGPVNVDVKNGRLTVSTEQHVDLIAHVYNRRSDREILKEVYALAVESARAGA